MHWSQSIWFKGRRGGRNEPIILDVHNTMGKYSASDPDYSSVARERADEGAEC